MLELPGFVIVAYGRLRSDAPPVPTGYPVPHLGGRCRSGDVRAAVQLQVAKHD